MLRYILKRVVSAIITIWFIMTLTFFLMKAIPGDPFSSEKMADPVIIENMKAKYGLDLSLIHIWTRVVAGQKDHVVAFIQTGHHEVLARGTTDQADPLVHGAELIIGKIGAAAVGIGDGDLLHGAVYGRLAYAVYDPTDLVVKRSSK